MLLLRFLLVSLMFFSPLALIAQGVIQLDTAVALSDAPVSVAVRSTDAGISEIAKKAFNLHGGFNVMAATEAIFQVKLTRETASSVRLVVGSGRPFQEQLNRVVSGKDTLEASLRACDLVVRAILRTKGFFAGELAFVGQRKGVSELYVSDLLFKDVRPITRDRSLVTGPRFSPDGSKLLYTTYFKSGFPDIYEINLKTRARRSFASYKGTNTGGSYSPDGRQVAMILSGSGSPELWVADSRGQNRKRLTRNQSLEASPSWSPDGQRLVFTSDSFGKPQLYQMSVAGGKMERIRTNVSGYCAEPVWNPVDANLIAFTAAVSSGFQVFVYDFKAKESRQLTTVAGSAIEPYWLSDGRHLVFTQRTGGQKRLMLLDTKSRKVSSLHSPKFGNASSASFSY